jgi:hypothetical protein
MMRARGKLSAAGRHARRWAVPVMWPVLRPINRVVRRGLTATRAGRLMRFALCSSPRAALTGGCAVLLVTLVAGILIKPHYTVSPAASQLLLKSSVKQSDIHEDKANFSYNRPATDHGKASLTVASDSTNQGGNVPYRAELAKASPAVQFIDGQNEDLKFKMVPQFRTSGGRRDGGHMTYPAGDSQQVYTYMRNGLKEDIILNNAPSSSDTLSYSWNLEMGSNLTAKLLDDGSVGVYSADPNLYGNLQVGDAKSQQLVDAAKQKGNKTNLAFLIPKPYIKDMAGKRNYDDVSFQLSGTTLTLTAKNLAKQTYPLSVDPTVVVSTAADFQTGNDDGMIDYTTGGEIGRSNVSGGTVGAFSTDTNHFTNPRYGHTSVAYNGYLYVIGGYDDLTYYSDVQKAAINGDGSIGAFSSTTSFTTGRSGHSTVVYNGYLYVIGGDHGVNNTACSGTSSPYCSDVQKAAINSDGTVGLWTTTTNLPFPRNLTSAVVANGYMYVLGGSQFGQSTACNPVNSDNCNDVQRAAIYADGTIGSWSTVSRFTTGRSDFSAVAYNGNLYVLGGSHATSDTACSTTTDVFCSDVQKASINPDGTVGNFSYMPSLPNARHALSAVAYNGYLYVIGGAQNATNTACNSTASAYCNDVQKAVINADGTIGSWASTTSFTAGRAALTSVVYHGYIYTIGGFKSANDTTCSLVTSTKCNDVQKTTFDISPPSPGTIGSFSNTTSFTAGRQGHAAVAYNGYIYITGGFQANSDTACNTVASNYCTDVQYAAINPDGMIGTFASAGNNFTGARVGHTSVAYNGYLYIIGGINGTIPYADVQKALINPDGTIGTFASAGNSFTNARAYHTSIANNGYLYIVGGYNGTSTYYNDVQYAAINPDGTIGTFASAGNSFTNARDYHSTVTANGYLYVIGGINGATYYADVQKALINPDGTIGTFASAGSSMSFGRFGHTSVAYKGYLYVMGGYHSALNTACNTSSSNYCNDVIKAAINPDGTIGTFASAGNSFTNARRYFAAVTYNGYIYIIGGIANVTYYADVQKTAIDSGTPTALGTDGTFASAGNTFSSFRYGHTSVAYNGYLYVIGGYNNATYYATVQKATINADGTVGTFASAGNSLPFGRYAHTSIAYNGYLYVIGGVHSLTDTACNATASAYCSDVQKATINPDGTIGTFASAGNSFTNARYAHSSAVYNGYLYVISGFDSTTYYNDVQKATINPDGTIGTFASAGNSLAVGRFYSSSVAYDGFLYVSGGSHGTSDTACNATASIYCSDVQKATINPDGTIGTFASAGNSFTNARYGHVIVAYNGYVYIIGGAGATNYNDVQKATINPDGTIGTFASAGNSFTNARYQFASVAYNGYLYVIGGHDTNGVFYTDVQKSSLQAPSQQANYEQTLDAGSVVSSVDSLIYNGSSVCGGNDLWYATAGSSGVFSAYTIIASAQPGVTYTITTANVRYVRTKIILDDQACGTNSTVSDITLNYTGNATPAAPTLTTPAASATGVSLTPQFQLRTTDAESDYLRYKIQVCSIADCSVVVRTIDQTASQTGWTGQNQQTSTAYTGSSVITSSTMASHTYQSPPLTAGTQYWWRAYGIDSGGSNTFSGTSSISTFTTNATPAVPTLVAPAAAATNVSTTPLFQLRTTDANNDYLRYKIQVCSTSNCGTVIRTIDQTASQTGWSGQDTQTSTAYVGNSTITSSTMANHTYQAAALTAGTQYWWRAFAIDPGGINVFTAASGINSFTTAGAQVAPAAPTLSTPSVGATGVAVTPTFTLSSTDANGDYIEYKIQVCSIADCSVVVRTIDQTASQTGWSGQDAQTGTAYATGTTATHIYQAAGLSVSTQYWWRAYAIDPGGTNTFSSASAIQTFTTAAAQQNTSIGGGTTFGGGTRIGN